MKLFPAVTDHDWFQKLPSLNPLQGHAPYNPHHLAAAVAAVGQVSLDLFDDLKIQFRAFGVSE